MKSLLVLKNSISRLSASESRHYQIKRQSYLLLEVRALLDEPGNALGCRVELIGGCALNSFGKKSLSSARQIHLIKLIHFKICFCS